MAGHDIGYLRYEEIEKYIEEHKGLSGVKYCREFVLSDAYDIPRIDEITRMWLVPSGTEVIVIVYYLRLL